MSFVATTGGIASNHVQDLMVAAYGGPLPDAPSAGARVSRS
jgi:hypothetical protein